MVKLPDLQSLGGGRVRVVRPARHVAPTAGNPPNGGASSCGACLGVPVDLIEPMGFEWTTKGSSARRGTISTRWKSPSTGDFEAFRAAAGPLILGLSTMAPFSLRL